MVRFMVKTGFVLCLAAFCILFGIETAANGLNRTEGVDPNSHAASDKFSTPLASVLKQVPAKKSVQNTDTTPGPQRADVEEKVKKLEEVNHFNPYETAGNLFSSGLTQVFKSGIQAGSRLLGAILIGNS